METDQKLVTFAEYMQLEDPDELVVLHHGRVVRRPIHTYRECALKNHLFRVFEKILHGDIGWMSLGYQPLPEYELWVAGFALVSQSRWEEAVRTDDYLQGSPEVVMEIVGPSITTEEIEDERELAMRTGCRQFWVVDSKTHTVHVTGADGSQTTYEEGSSIPLPEPWLGKMVPLSDIFSLDRHGR
jgi:hypothetical protein